MTTDLLVTVIVLAAVLIAAFLGYWSGRDAGYREAVARQRARARGTHPSNVSVTRYIAEQEWAEREARLDPRIARHLHVADPDAS